MVAKHKETWVLIADGMRARILKWQGHDRFTAALGQEMYDPAVHGHSRDLKSDRPGRAFDPGSGAHHAIEPRHDPHQQEKHLFTRRVAQMIDAAAARNAFDRLILVAPPKTLGDLRTMLGAVAAKRVIGDVHKDLIHTPINEIASHLGEILIEGKGQALS